MKHEQRTSWQDLAEDLKDPEFLREYISQSVRIALSFPQGDLEPALERIAGLFADVMPSTRATLSRGPVVETAQCSGCVALTGHCRRKTG